MTCRSTPIRTGRAIAVLLAAICWAAACASDAADAGRDEAASATTEAPAADDAPGVGADADRDADADHSTDDVRDVDPASAVGSAGSDDEAQPVVEESSADSDGEASGADDGGRNEDGAVGTDRREADGGSEATPGDTVSDPSAVALRAFTGCDALVDYIHTHAAPTVGPWGLGGELGGDLALARSEALEAGNVASDGAAAGDADGLQAGVDYSTSNVQEAGIDEPAALKTDGRRMVVASENRVRVVDVRGAEPTLVGTVDLGDLWEARLLLHGDRVLVLASTWGPSARPDPPVPGAAGDGVGDASDAAESPDEAAPRADVVGPWRPPGWGPTTRIVEIDLAAATPSVTADLRIDGSYLGARLTDGVVRIVTSSRPRAIPWTVPTGAGAAEQLRATEANRQILASTTADHWRPGFRLTDATGETVDEGPLVDCSRIWVPPHYSGPGTLSVTTIDIAAAGIAGPHDTTSILADGTTVYASADWLFVTTTRWFDSYAMPELAPRGDGADAEGDDAGDDDAGRSHTHAEPASHVTTEIHQFDISGPKRNRYLVSASVPGTVLNQYSMSDHEGYLRIATTTVPPWFADGSGADAESESIVTVLDSDPGADAGHDGPLPIVGQVRGLGRGERIYAVRYMGDTAAVVTFRQVDPLYLLDLSDPSAPTVQGELKINGYSAYLHPLSDGLLLGVGQDATDEGRTLGTQVSLFDISNPAEPRRIDQWTEPGAHSRVEFDALSFLYWPPRAVAVLPLVRHPHDAADAQPPFLGAVALSTADWVLTERARFSHADPPARRCTESRDIVVQPDGTEERGPLQRYCWYDTDYRARITASAVVGDRLYLASAKGLESVSLDSWERASLLLWP